MKFKVGDVVEVINSRHGNKGRISTVCTAFPNEYYLEYVFGCGKFNECIDIYGR